MPSDNQCPVCHTAARPEEAFSLLLTKPNPSREQKANALEIRVQVCPHCKILYFRDMDYATLQGIRDGIAGGRA